MLRDLFSNVKASRGISPAAAVTDNTAFVSQILDTANFGSALFIGQLGALTDVNATFTVLVEHGDVSNLSDAAAVPDEFLNGLEAATITSGVSAGNGAQFGFADDNKTFKIGYVGPKRYVRVTVTPAANDSGNIFLAGIWLQGFPRVSPQSTQVV